MAAADLEPGYRYHKRILKLLQWKNPRKQWILKNSACLEELTYILKVYPDVCFVWPHRDPTKSVASTVSLIGSMLWAGTDRPFKGASLDQYMDPYGAAKRLTDVIDLIESGVLPKERVHNLLYRDLVDDPVETAAKIHDYFGLPFSAESREALEAYMRQNPRTKRPPHKVSAETRAAVDRDRPAFKRYQDYFGVPDESLNDSPDLATKERAEVAGLLSRAWNATLSAAEADQGRKRGTSLQRGASLHPPTNVTSRIARTDVQVHGATIPAGSMVAVAGRSARGPAASLEMPVRARQQSAWCRSTVSCGSAAAPDDVALLRLLATGSASSAIRFSFMSCKVSASACCRCSEMPRITLAFISSAMWVIFSRMTCPLFVRNKRLTRLSSGSARRSMNPRSSSRSIRPPSATLPMSMTVASSVCVMPLSPWRVTLVRTHH